MKKAAVITVGYKNESLGALKLAAWLRETGWSVMETKGVTPTLDPGCDLYAFSVVFSWRLPIAVALINQAKSFGAEVWVGGPAVTFSTDNAAYVARLTGVMPSIGIDERFERQSGNFPMTYFSRGCPAYTPACGLCPVPRIEGNAFRYYPHACVAPLSLDNNLSALPDEYQDYIIHTYAHEWKNKRLKVDANSGFEPHTFTEKTLLRWKKFPLACWRFGYDDITERDQALEMMRLLKAHDIQGKRVRVYTLIGNEPREICERRINDVIAAGCHPWPQRLRPLDWREGILPTRFDWDEQTLVAFQRFYSIGAFWRYMPQDDFYYQSRYPLRKS